MKVKRELCVIKNILNTEIKRTRRVQITYSGIYSPDLSITLCN